MTRSRGSSGRAGPTAASVPRSPRRSASCSSATTAGPSERAAPWRPRRSGAPSAGSLLADRLGVLGAQLRVPGGVVSCEVVTALVADDLALLFEPSASPLALLISGLDGVALRVTHTRCRNGRWRTSLSWYWPEGIKPEPAARLVGRRREVEALEATLVERDEEIHRLKHGDHRSHGAAPPQGR